MYGSDCLLWLPFTKVASDSCAFQRQNQRHGGCEIDRRVLHVARGCQIVHLKQKDICRHLTASAMPSPGVVTFADTRPMMADHTRKVQYLLLCGDQWGRFVVALSLTLNWIKRHVPKCFREQPNLAPIDRHIEAFSGISLTAFTTMQAAHQIHKASGGSP